MTSLSERQLRPEWMDQPGLDAVLHRDALRGLERLNAAAAAVRAVWAPLAALSRRRPGVPLSFLDVACGAGDVAIGLAGRARRTGVDLAVEGCDISPTAIAHARQRGQRAGLAIRFFEHDVLHAPIPGRYDAVGCSLFLHHLDHDDAVRLLGAMARAARAVVIVSDLDRSRVGLVLAWLATRVLTRSPVVHADGPQSVRAAFTAAEAAALAEEAGLGRFRLRRVWPCRWQLVIDRAA